MKRVWIPFCFIVGAAMLAYDLYFWGGLASTSEVGSIVRERASTFSFLAWSYMSAGFGMVDMLGSNEGAASFARGQIGDLLAGLNADPLTTLDGIFKALPWYALCSYYGAPLLILLGIFAQSRKPKPFNTYGSR